MRYLNFLELEAYENPHGLNIRRQLVSRVNQRVQYCVILPLGINSIWMFFPSISLFRTASPVECDIILHFLNRVLCPLSLD